MKVIRTGFMIILAAFLLPSCVKDNRDDCPDDPDYNLALHFEYFDNEGKDVFADCIESIDLLIFDQYLNLYQRLNLDEVIDHPERTKYLDIEPGVYYMVSWANNFNNRLTRPGTGGMDDNYVFHGANPESAERLHYAPDKRRLSGALDPDDLSLYMVNVARKGTTHDTVSYMSAHRTVNVYIKGFPEPAVNGGNPVISISHLADYYDNLLNATGDGVSYGRVAVDTTIVHEGVEGEYGYAGFYVPHFDNESPVMIYISGERITGEAYTYTYSMDKALEELGITVWDGDAAVINIVIELRDDVYVIGYMPPWLVTDVEGDYN